MAKTIVIRESSIAELVLGDKHNHYYSSDKEEVPSGSEREVEDVAFEEVDAHFKYLTELCREKKMVEYVENALRAACHGTAEELWKCIHENEILGYLDTQGISSGKLYRDICAFFGPLDYTYRNFNKYR